MVAFSRKLEARSLRYTPEKKIIIAKKIRSHLKSEVTSKNGVNSDK